MAKSISKNEEWRIYTTGERNVRQNESGTGQTESKSKLKEKNQRVNVRSTEKKEKEAQPVLGRARGTNGIKQTRIWRRA